MLEQWRSRSSFPRWDSHTHFIPPFIYIYKSPQVYQQFGDLHGRGRKHDWNMTCLKAIRTGFALRIPLGAKLKGYETRRLLRIIHRPAIQKRTNGGGLFLAWEPIDRFQSEAPRHIVLYKFERTRGAKSLLKMAIKATVPLLTSSTYCLSLALFISSSFGPVWHYRHKALVCASRGAGVVQSCPKGPDGDSLVLVRLSRANMTWDPRGTASWNEPHGVHIWRFTGEAV